MSHLLLALFPNIRIFISLGEFEMASKPHYLTPIGVALIVTSTAGMAQESELGAISVYGERPAAFRNITTSTATATADLIEHTNVINTEDAVKYLPSIQIRKRYVGDRNAIVSSRNAGTLDSARSLVYADNVLVSNLLGNSYAFAPRWWFVAPQEIERVDVSYGAHSAAYAGNAVGVVMVMKSRLPDSFEAHADAQAFRQNFKLYGTKDDYDGSRVGAFLGNRHGDLRWTFSLNHLENTGHPMSFATASRSTTPAGVGDKAVSGYVWEKDPKNNDRVVMGGYGIDRTVQDNAKIKLAYDFSPGSRLTYTLGYWRNDSNVSVESYLRDAAGNPVYSGNVNIDGRRYTLSATALQPSMRNEEHWMNSLTYRFDPNQLRHRRRHHAQADDRPAGGLRRRPWADPVAGWHRVVYRRPAGRLAAASREAWP
jgi:iron complex outermembrane receptor protein